MANKKEGGRRLSQNGRTERLEEEEGQGGGGGAEKDRRRGKPRKTQRDRREEVRRLCVFPDY